MTASGYTRQSSAAIASGQPLTSAPVNNEFNQLQAAFDGTSGHDHSGGTGMGPGLGASAFGGLTSASVGFAAANGSNSFNVITLTGTSNQIAITNGTGAAGNPVFSIAAGYVGQTSITTLGTITTGVWNGTILSPTYGGTGVNNSSSTLTLGGNVAFSGAFATTLTVTAGTSLTLPTSGTLATQTFVSGTYAPLASPALTGVPTAPTATNGTNTTQIATTAFVNAATGAFGSITQVNAGTGLSGGGTSGAVTLTLVTPVASTNGGTGVSNTGTLTYGTSNITLTTSGATSLTLPTSGTVATTATTTLSSLVSIGTITTGVWNGSLVAGQYGGTGVANTGKTISLGGNFATSGAFAVTLAATALTNITLPTSGTLIADTVTTLSSLVSIGTITTGTWHGAVVAGQYGGTGVANTGNTITLGGNISTGGNLTTASTFVTSGAFSVTLTATNTTTLTLPNTGTLAVIASPTFTGTPAAPTAAQGNNSTQLATTAYADAIGSTKTSWTPVLHFGGVNVGITYTTQLGTYLKVGKFVIAECTILLSSKGSSTGNASVTGLPLSANGGGYAAMNDFNSTTGNFANQVNGSITGTTIALIYNTASGSANLTDADFTNTSSFQAVALYIAS